MARILAPLLQQGGVPTALAWFDHGWRDGREDEQTVEALGRALCVPLRIGRASPDPAGVRSVGREAAARDARRSFLLRVRAELGASRIYLAHHEDDQIETILLRRRRGTPISRAAGMKALDGPFARPFLTVPAREIRETARTRGWTWTEDPTNVDTSLLRNRLRAELRGKPLAPDARRDVLRQGESARARIDATEEAARALPTAAAGLWIPGLLAAPDDVAIRAVQERCVGASVSARGILALRDRLRRVPSPPRWNLGAGWWAVVRGDSLRIDPPRPVPPAPQVAVLQLSGDAARARLGRPGIGRDWVVFDRAALRSPRVERPLDGARIRPYGVSGTRNVRDLMREAGVPAGHRSTWPVLADDGEILWIPWIRASSHAPVSEATLEALLFYTVPPRATAVRGPEAAIR
jgi:tRNA(Ile)-lysidine synthase